MRQALFGNRSSPDTIQVFWSLGWSDQICSVRFLSSCFCLTSISSLVYHINHQRQIHQTDVPFHSSGIFCQRLRISDLIFLIDCTLELPDIKWGVKILLKEDCQWFTQARTCWSISLRLLKSVSISQDAMNRWIFEWKTKSTWLASQARRYN